MAMTPVGPFRPSSGSNNGHLVVMRTGTAIATFTRKDISGTNYSAGDQVSRITIRKRPADTARQTTLDGTGGITTGNSSAL